MNPEKRDHRCHSRRWRLIFRPTPVLIVMLERLSKPACWGDSLELTVQLLEENARKTKENNYEFTKAMKRCVIVRDEQINAQRSEIEKKDKVIAEMKVKIVASETKIDELLKKMKTLEEGTNSDSLRVAKGTPDTAVVIEETRRN